MLRRIIYGAMHHMAAELTEFNRRGIPNTQYTIPAVHD
jgi:hypothetical protein